MRLASSQVSGDGPVRIGGPRIYLDDDPFGRSLEEMASQLSDACDASKAGRCWVVGQFEI